jgi:hypothetical protein
MALGFSTDSNSAGDILPIVKYDAKGGDFIAVNRSQSEDGQWVKSEQEIALPVNIGMDLENIEVGWMAFIGGRPDFVMAKIGGAMPAKPSDEHKQAFRVRIGSKDLGLREFSHSAKTVLRAMDELHSSYLAEAGANARCQSLTLKASRPLRCRAKKASFASRLHLGKFRAGLTALKCLTLQAHRQLLPSR